MARTLSPDAARRIAVAAQGLARPRPTSVDVRHFRRVMQHVKVVQLDSVNVVARTHYLPFFARLGAYDMTKLDRWAAHSGELFEYWCHAASWAPIEDYPLFHWRRQTMGAWQSVERLAEEHPEYIDSVFEAVARRGPLTISDLEDRGERTGAWWGYGRGKTALEYLFAKGRIASYRLPDFKRVYDLPERLIPNGHLEEQPSIEDSYRALLLKAAEACGVATAKDLVDYYRLKAKVAKPVLAQLVAEGGLEAIEVGSWQDDAYLHPAAKRPRSITGRTLLSPFDSLVWERDRTERIFDFHYRIEIYVPEKDRRYGYYVLPFLLDGELVGRVDLKSDRKAGRLIARAAHVEDGADPVRVARELALELHDLAAMLGLEDVAVMRKGGLASALAAAV